MASVPLTCDLVIVGAGLAGALTARRLAEEGWSVVVFESTQAVGGGAVPGPGVALLGTPKLYVDLVEREGREDARRIWELTRENLSLLRRAAEGVGVAVSEVGSLRPVLSTAEAASLQESAELLQEEGFDVTVEDATELNMLVALQTAGDLACDPVALAEALLDHPNVTLQLGTEVHEFEGVEDGVLVHAKKHHLRSGAVVTAAGPHAVHLSRDLGSVLRVAALRAADCKGREPPASPLILGSEVLVHDVGGRCRMTGWAGVGEDPWSMLAETAAYFYPEAVVEGRHSRWVARSTDGLPLVGAVPDLPGVYAIAGLGPWGLSWVAVAVEGLVHLLLGEEIPSLLRSGRLF
jgi:glycine/D-amino acid oxidase-like deaminating enzyme